MHPTCLRLGAALWVAIFSVAAAAPVPVPLRQRAAAVDALLAHGGGGLARNVVWETDGERTCSGCSFGANAVTAAYDVLSPHWAHFQNVCYYYDGVDGYRRKLLFLHNGTTAGRAYAEDVAANATEREWPNQIVALDAASPLATRFRFDMFKGWWYHNHADYGNIAHVFQELACQLASLLSPAHRASLPVPIVFDGVLVSRLDIVSGSADRMGWTHMQVLWMIESIAAQPEQHGRPLHVDDTVALGHDPTAIRCYENVVVQRGCGGHSLDASKFPNGSAQAMAAYRRTVFATLRLEKIRARPCEPSILIYGRPDQPFRRMVNAEELAAALRRTSTAFNVTVLTQMPRTVFEQARLFNGADVHITVHSASIYNSIFLPDNAMLFEVHANTWWGRGGMAQFMEQGAGQVYTLVKDVRHLPQESEAARANDADIEVLPDGIQKIVDAVLARYGPHACPTSTVKLTADPALETSPPSAVPTALENAPPVVSLTAATTLGPATTTTPGLAQEIAPPVVKPTTATTLGPATPTTPGRAQEIAPPVVSPTNATTLGPATTTTLDLTQEIAPPGVSPTTATTLEPATTTTPDLTQEIAPPGVSLATTTTLGPARLIQENAPSWSEEMATAVPAPESFDISEVLLLLVLDVLCVTVAGWLWWRWHPGRR